MSKQKSYYAELPLSFDAAGLPCVDVVIEGSTYSFVVDLGSRLGVSIYPNILKQLDKQPRGIENYKNYRGTNFGQQSYTLPSLKIGSLTFKDPIAVELSLEEEEESEVWNNSKTAKTPIETIGALGRGVLKKVNILFDVEQSKIIFTNSFNKLKSNGYDIKTFEKVPFIIGPKGINIEVDTSLGKNKLLLDTGSTLTMFHEFLYPQNIEKKIDHRGFSKFPSSKILINSQDFGSQDLYFLDMTAELHDIDGLLGMDFIKRHVIYVDFSKKTLYIQNTPSHPHPQNRQWKTLHP